MTTPIRIAVIDDHMKIHLGIAAAVEAFDDLEVVAHGNSGREALELCAQYNPDIVLMDVIMPDMDGIQATQAIHERFPSIKVVALSSYQDEEGVRAMLQAGAVGYVLKTASIDDLAHTIRAANAGKIVFSPEIAQTLLKPPPSQSEPGFGLTQREREILQLLVQGLNNSEIAAALTISISTAKYHVSSIFTKLKVSNRVEAATLAKDKGLVD
jgi:two-component system, NarL family, response regulator LiaR